MAGERRRYRNPLTDIIQYEADPTVADILGLEPWDGETEEIEKDKVTGIERAVHPEPDSQDSLESVTTDPEDKKPAGKPAAGDKK